MRDPEELISGYFDGSLEADEVAELDRWLSGSPERLRQFARASILHSRLHDVLIQHDVQGLVADAVFGEAVDPQHVASLLDEERAAMERREREERERLLRQALLAERQAEVQVQSPRPAPRSPWTAAPAIASYVTAAAVLVMAFRPAPPEPPREVQRNTRPVAPAVVEPPVIATVAEAFDVRLTRSGLPLALAARLTPGTISVEEGVAKIKFTTGTSLVIEGPAELELIGPERAKLFTGRVVAHVPKYAIGFTLLAQGTSFVDLGTEFGVEVGAAGKAEVHVLDGEVALVADKRLARPSVTLRKGDAREVSAQGAVRDVPMDATRFFRRVPATAYEFAIQRSRPLAYWRLDSAEPGSTIQGDGKLRAAALVSGLIATAPLPADAKLSQGGPRGAALFAGDHDGIDVPNQPQLGQVSNLTCEAWVSPAPAPTGPRRIFSTFDRPRSGLAIGVVDGAWYKLSAEDDLRFQLTLYGVYDCVSAQPLPRDAWVHVAATVDEAGKPLLYVNGEVAEKRFRPPHTEAGPFEDPAPEPEWMTEHPTPVGKANSGFARIGRNPTGTDGQVSPERWQGQISHVAVYDRVLSAQELREHYDATRDSTQPFAPRAKQAP